LKSHSCSFPRTAIPRQAQISSISSFAIDTTLVNRKFSLYVPAVSNLCSRRKGVVASASGQPRFPEKGLQLYPEPVF
jgi:hypothetical protein